LTAGCVKLIGRSRYATWLGMDLQSDQELFYIAKEGLKAPLPGDWKPCRSPDGEIYYFNFSNGDSVWDHPCDEHYRAMFRIEKEKLRQLFAMRVSKRLLAVACCLSERLGSDSMMGLELPVELMECIADELRRLPSKTLHPTGRPRLSTPDSAQRVSEGVPPTRFDRLRASPTQVATAALASLFHKRKPELQLEPEPEPEFESAQAGASESPALSDSYLTLLDQVDSDCETEQPLQPAESSSDGTNVSSPKGDGAARDLLDALSNAQKDALLLTVLRDYPEVALQASAALAVQSTPTTPT
jgi:hypothetical protein